MNYRNWNQNAADCLFGSNRQANSVSGGWRKKKIPIILINSLENHISLAALIQINRPQTYTNWIFRVLLTDTIYWMNHVPKRTLIGQLECCSLTLSTEWIMSTTMQSLEFPTEKISRPQTYTNWTFRVLLTDTIYWMNHVHNNAKSRVSYRKNQ